jgi:hypothetical protein
MIHEPMEGSQLALTFHGHESSLFVDRREFHSRWSANNERLNVLCCHDLLGTLCADRQIVILSATKDKK